MNKLTSDFIHSVDELVTLVEIFVDRKEPLDYDEWNYMKELLFDVKNHIARGGAPRTSAKEM